jgi:hypothetical protein
MIFTYNSSFDNRETLYPFCSELRVLLFKRLDTMVKNREWLQIDKLNFFNESFLLILISGIWFQIQIEFWTFFFFCRVVCQTYNHLHRMSLAFYFWWYWLKKYLFSNFQFWEHIFVNFETYNPSPIPKTFNGLFCL